jgi:hypothetical protein
MASTTEFLFLLLLSSMGMSRHTLASRPISLPPYFLFAIVATSIMINLFAITLLYIS